MPAPDLSAVWVANPDLVTSAIKLLAGAVLALGGVLIAGLRWITGMILKRVETRMDSMETKLDRVAVSLETLTLNTAVDIAELKATCKANHRDH